MALSFKTFVVLSLLVIVSVSVSLTFADNTIALVYLCKEAASEDSCRTAMDSDPRTPIAPDFMALAQICVQMSQVAAETGKNIALKEESPAFKTCRTKYEEAIVKLNDAKKALGSRDFTGLNTAMLAAMNSSQACNDCFPKVEELEQFSRILYNAGEDVRGFGNALLVFSKHLSNGELALPKYET